MWHIHLTYTTSISYATLSHNMPSLCIPQCTLSQCRFLIFNFCQIVVVIALHFYLRGFGCLCCVAARVSKWWLAVKWCDVVVRGRLVEARDVVAGACAAAPAALRAGRRGHAAPGAGTLATTLPQGSPKRRLHWTLPLAVSAFSLLHIVNSLSGKTLLLGVTSNCMIIRLPQRKHGFYFLPHNHKCNLKRNIIMLFAAIVCIKSACHKTNLVFASHDFKLIAFSRELVVFVSTSFCKVSSFLTEHTLCWRMVATKFRVASTLLRFIWKLQDKRSSLKINYIMHCSRKQTMETGCFCFPLNVPHLSFDAYVVFIIILCYLYGVLNIYACHAHTELRSGIQNQNKISYGFSPSRIPNGIPNPYKIVIPSRIIPHVCGRPEVCNFFTLTSQIRLQY